MENHIIPLKNEFLEVGISPACGASLVYFRTSKKIDLLRPASQTAIAKKDALNLSMFPMLPYCFRIKNNSFVYWGITRNVAPTHSQFKEAIHGDGWKESWTVIEQTDSSVTLNMKHDKSKGFPFCYEATITYTLTKDTLEARLSLVNKGIMPMPCGLGLHPFFVKSPDVKLNFTVRDVWQHEQDPIETPYHIPTDWSFQEEKELSSTIFDTCFGGFDGKAKITWPKDHISLEMTTDEQFRHLALYAPYRKSFFCLEPSTMTVDAFNIASKGTVGTGIQSIGKDESLSGKIIFRVKEW